MVSQWATPRAEERQQHNSQDDYVALSKQVTQWPTATARDWKSTKASQSTHEKNSRPLSEVVGQHAPVNPSTIGKPRGSLNSAFVANLMGYPPDWLDLPIETLSALLATRSSRKSSQRSQE